ncbi:MAG: hypothetical protein AAFQ36_04530 [Pseudomonadota bacterium]
MTAAQFSLVVATSADGFIARHPGDSPTSWASAEEQAIFFEHVDRADWSVMGRHTHEVADRPDRRRIVFSTQTAGWQRPTQLWLNPADNTPASLAEHVNAVHPLEHALILGGTRVHDWFLAQNAIAAVYLTVEPIRFGTGLPLFSEHIGPPLEVLEALGFTMHANQTLNRQGTRYITLKPWP